MNTRDANLSLRDLKRNPYSKTAKGNLWDLPTALTMEIELTDSGVAYLENIIARKYKGMVTLRTQHFKDNAFTSFNKITPYRS